MRGIHLDSFIGIWSEHTINKGKITSQLTLYSMKQRGYSCYFSVIMATYIIYKDLIVGMELDDSRIVVVSMLVIVSGLDILEVNYTRLLDSNTLG